MKDQVVPKIGFSGIQNQPNDGFLRQVKHGISSFFLHLGMLQLGKKNMIKNAKFIAKYEEKLA